jgi:crossover junction endodeoxyribonuclease RuvC
MLHNLLKYEELPESLDATDGLAVAVCHYFQGLKESPGKSYSGWASFVGKNKDRIV